MIKVNLKAKKANINIEIKRGISEIKSNAKAGVSTTELVFNKEIYDEVRTGINEYMKKNKVSYTWLSMSGPVGMQSSIACGDGRLMKFKLTS